MSDEIICGVNVRLLKEQCERLAEPIRASTRSFQFASALDNSVAVINELQARLSALAPSPAPSPLVTAEHHNAAFDPANDALGGAFKDGFREGWLFAQDPGFDNREELEGDYHHVVDIAPSECWDAYREKYFAMLPLAAIPEVSQ